MWKFPLYEIELPIPWEEIENRFDWIKDMKGVKQDLIWHAEGDVFTHTKMVTEALVSHPDFKVLSEQDKHILFAVSLLHDVEKRSTTEVEEIDGEKRITSRGHAKKGERTARQILYRDIPTPFEIREHICKLVRHHGLPIWAIEKENPQFEVVSSSFKLNTKLLSLFAKADILGRISNDTKDMMIRVELFEELCIENNCFGNQKKFSTESAKRYYFKNRGETFIDYIPYESNEFKVYLMCALPGSGKDTYIQSKLSGIPVVSIDDIRRKNKIRRGDSKAEGQAIQEAKELAKSYLRKKETFIWNATNITREMRSKLISDFEEYGAAVEIIYIEVPYNQLIKQNNDREHIVPIAAMNRLISGLEVPDETECNKITIYHG